MIVNFCCVITVLGAALRGFFGYSTISQQPYEGGIIFTIPILKARKWTWKEKECAEDSTSRKWQPEIQSQLPGFRVHTLNQ